MWDKGIWEMRYRGDSWKELVDALERFGKDSEHGLLIDAEIARRVATKAASASTNPEPSPAPIGTTRRPSRGQR